MEPYEQPLATWEAMFEGYAGARDRFHSATKDRDPVATFVPLFEALNWAVALDDRAADHWIPDGRPPLGWAWRERVPGAEPMSGIRFARNRVHHQWADALVFADGERRYPRDYDLVYFEWLWRPASELPSPRDPRHQDAHGEAVYAKLLAGRPARASLASLGQAFAFLRSVMEPHSLRIDRAARTPSPGGLTAES